MGNNRGFSLTELAVSLVIIGMIAGSVMTANGFLNNAKLRVTIKEFKEYRDAAAMFKEKFKYLPGDIPNITKYYTGETNGNGNWYMNRFDVNTENITFWRHLMLTGYINGSYSGTGATHALDSNTGAAKGFYPGKKMGYYIAYDTFAGGYYLNGTRNVLTLNILDPASSLLTLAALNAHDARYIDLKMDDDDPDEGKMYALRSSLYNATATCVTAYTTADVADWDLDDSAVSCRMALQIE